MHSQSQNRPATNRQLPREPLNSESAVHGCGWFDSSYELSQGLVVTEDSYDSHHCLAAWPELTRIILGQSMLDSLNPARFSYAAISVGRHRTSCARS